MFTVIILAIVQGLCEFLPISSSGHLVLINSIMQNSGDFLLLFVILHVATLISVVYVLKHEVLGLFKHPFSNITKKLVVATIPTVIIVLVFKNIFKDAFLGKYLPFCFMVTAFVILLCEILNKNGNKNTISSTLPTQQNHYYKNDPKIDLSASQINIGYKTAIIMGIMQGVAVLPGISRSGFTICGGLIAKENREDVARFSFLMSIPIILASLVFEIYDFYSSGMALSFNWYDLLVGFLIATLVGIFSARFMLKFVSKHSLMPFVVYLVFVSILSFFVIF
ncbi:MAG: undecaprenyl-diphosphate phosphatase [Clostridia bacterium]|nr:undecaprenyl-diphosphate phosphatase [Clostridia bacterium]